MICEIMNDDGTMARTPQLIEFCRTHGLKLVTVADLIRYRMQHERYVRRIAESVLPTRHGNFRMIAYSSDVDNELHVALVRGDISSGTTPKEPPLVRVHSHCLTGDVFGATACDCHSTIRAIARSHRKGRTAACSSTCITAGADFKSIRVRRRAMLCRRFGITGAVK